MCSWLSGCLHAFVGYCGEEGGHVVAFDHGATVLIQGIRIACFLFVNIYSFKVLESALVVDQELAGTAEYT